jgi:hypothetical protein
MNGPKLPFVAGLVAAVQLPQSRPLSLPQHLSASMTAQRDKVNLRCACTDGSFRVFATAEKCATGWKNIRSRR